MDMAWGNIFGGIIALVVSPLLLTTLWRASRTWGARDSELSACIDGLESLVKKMDDFMSRAEKEYSEIKSHVAKQSYILTGAEGLNGLQGAVKELHKAFTARNDADHVYWGNLGLWQQNADTRLSNIEERVGPPERRQRARSDGSGRRKKPS